MRWFRALGRMKMAAIMGHNLRRHREGKHHDPDQERLPPTIAAMIRTALELLT
jgi:streptomycin 6-kinase